MHLLLECYLVDKYEIDFLYKFTRAQKLLYIIGITLLPTIPGAFFVFSDFPLYTTYEFATRVFNGLSAREDQMYAGLIMWMGMTPILLIRLAMAFFSWSESESRRAGTID